MYIRITSLALTAFLAGCASSPNFDTTLVDRSLTPSSVTAEPAISLGKTAIWGGTILDTRNLKDSTQIEVLAYPLNASQRPLQESKPLGRFIILQKGYIEPATYAQGRQLTVIGTINKQQVGKIGKSQYTYPVIRAEKLHLWEPYSDKSKTSFHFGIGIGL